MRVFCASLLFILHSSCFISARAQGRADAWLMGGANVCQVDGDNSGRYNHLGLRAGVGASFALGSDMLSPWRLVVELAYTQKGSHMESSNGDISLQYVEVPLMLAYDAMEGQLRIGAGVAPAVNVGCAVTFDGIADASQEALYKRFDWLPLTVSAEYMLSGHLGVVARWQYSLLSVYDGSGPYRLFRANHGAFNRLISLGLVYRF